MKYGLGIRTYSVSKFVYLFARNCSSKVPAAPVLTLEKKKKDKIKIDSNIIALLERLSLVKCDTAEGVKVLEDSIEFADKILHINTDNVQPFYSVLENENLYLREDQVTQGHCQKDILKNALVTEDDYFVAPPGNIPLHDIGNYENSEEIKQCNIDSIITSLETPSVIIVQNIYKSWLQSIQAKTHQHYPVYLNENIAKIKSDKQKLFYGYIEQCLSDKIEEVNIGFNDDICTIKSNSELKFSAVIPQQDIMQVFTQWQRYRKYWWSSVTTTPGLFSVIDMKYEDVNTNANIAANFKTGQWIVETLKVSPHCDTTNKSKVSCTMSLEKSLLTLLLDAVANTKEEYLRLHSKITPYKISFAINYTDKNNFKSLQELAILIFYKLQSRRISTWLPKFSLPLEPQIKENLQMGVTYTAILSDNTLSNGIFHLMNSSTMLKEQVHLADFENYAVVLCGKRS